MFVTPGQKATLAPRTLSRTQKGLSKSTSNTVHPICMVPLNSNSKCSVFSILIFIPTLQKNQGRLREFETCAETPPQGFAKWLFAKPQFACLKTKIKNKAKPLALLVPDIPRRVTTACEQWVEFFQTHLP